jgi:hypothetical protein
MPEARRDIESSAVDDGERERSDVAGPGVHYELPRRDFRCLALKEGCRRHLIRAGVATLGMLVGMML